jgi:hypothetical protein
VPWGEGKPNICPPEFSLLGEGKKLEFNERRKHKIIIPKFEIT